jgi:hypothetical protein
MPVPTPYAKTIICLANSRRPGGRCFAGKEFANGKAGSWVRPVNGGNSNAISEEDRQYKDGTQADLLDIVKIWMKTPQPHAHHQEDHQILTDHYWEKTGRATWPQIVAATDKVTGTLWPNEAKSFHGFNDKVTGATAASLTNSLWLIAPTRLDLVVNAESQWGGAPDRRRVRADFDFNGERYNFVVTDLWIEEKYFAGENGTYRVNDSRLCVSLPEILSGFSTKLVAAVITADRAA